METQNTNFFKILKKIKSPDFVFLYVIFAFFAIVIILFTFSTNFVVENVNKIFLPGSVESDQALNRENYSLVVKRLNLPINTIPENTTINTPVVEPVIPPTVITPATNIVPPPSKPIKPPKKL